MPKIISCRAAAIAAALLAVALSIAGCTSSSSSSGHAAAGSGKAAAQSALANPEVSADMARLESQLLVAYQQNFNPAHPITSMEKAIHVVFPSGNAKLIATTAVHDLTPAMAGTSAAAQAARHAWAQKVVTYALASNPAAAASSGQAEIPGVPAVPAPSPSAKSS